MIWRSRFNIYLTALLALVIAVGAGCKTGKTKRKNIVSAIRLHLEVNRDASGRSQPVSVFRSNPVEINVEKAAFLSEGLLTDAKVVEMMGGFGLQLTFERRGAWLLEQYTAGAQGKRIAIYAEFIPDPDQPKVIEKRWLAAPVINKRITDGVLTFTPDASREECEKILFGISNLLRKIKKG